MSFGDKGVNVFNWWVVTTSLLSGSYINPRERVRSTIASVRDCASAQHNKRLNEREDVENNSRVSCFLLVHFFYSLFAGQRIKEKYVKLLYKNNISPYNVNCT